METRTRTHRHSRTHTCAQYINIIPNNGTYGTKCKKTFVFNKTIHCYISVFLNLFKLVYKCVFLNMSNENLRLIERKYFILREKIIVTNIIDIRKRYCFVYIVGVAVLYMNHLCTETSTKGYKRHTQRIEL